jgi:hypothetical protein
MPMWTDLDRAVAASGLAVKVGYSGWKSYGHGTPGPVEGVVCHHTAGPPTGDTPSLNTVVYGRSDLPGPLCNLYLSRSGKSTSSPQGSATTQAIPGARLAG